MPDLNSLLNSEQSNLSLAGLKVNSEGEIVPESESQRDHFERTLEDYYIKLQELTSDEREKLLEQPNKKEIIKAFFINEILQAKVFQRIFVVALVTLEQTLQTAIEGSHTILGSQENFTLMTLFMTIIMAIYLSIPVIRTTVDLADEEGKLTAYFNSLRGRETYITEEIKNRRIEKLNKNEGSKSAEAKTYQVEKPNQDISDHGEFTQALERISDNTTAIQLTEAPKDDDVSQFKTENN